jgi:serine/threonine protein kinase
MSSARDCGTALISGLEGGSARWMSIERLCSQDSETYMQASLRKESDMWSLGMLVLEAFTGQVPYCHLSKDMDVLIASVHGDRPSRPMDWDVIRYGLDDELWGMLWKCWEVDARLRPTLPYFLSVMERLAGSWSNRPPS